MLGIRENIKYWQWAACGKHPMARDYFYIGKNDPLVKAFSDWVGKGYQDMTLKKDPGTDLCSWRFWAKGPKKEILISGLLRGSSDLLGRPYPLLIMGAGLLKRWEMHWDLVPFACEKTWNQAESISTGMIKDLKTFEDEVLKIKPPSSQWQEFDCEREKSEEQSGNLKALEDTISRESEKSEIIAALDQRESCDQLTLISLWHFFLKKYTPVIPNVVFMGGTPEKAYLVIFKRPLLPDDFSRLWLAPSED